MRIGRHDVALTNLDKVFFPAKGLTKGDLVRHYVALAEFIIPHVGRRPMQMLRYPHGVGGDFFYQKRVPNPHPDWLETVHVLFPGSGRTADFPVVTNAAGLAWIANLGCIDLHTWHCRVDDVERPDYMLIDLDPSAGNPWLHVRAIAMVVKGVMDELGLSSFPKTSGATGLHILCPIRPELRFPEVRRFAKALAQEVERRIGDQEVATTTWKVADRRGVFVDYGQNTRDRTICVRLLDQAGSGRARLDAALLGRGTRGGARRLHSRDAARPPRAGRRPHRRDVAAQGQPRVALRAAWPGDRLGMRRLRSSCRVGLLRAPEP